MLSLSPIYILVRAFAAVGAFFRHWYVDGFFVFFHKLIAVISSFDQTFAFKVTLRNLFKPLYQDYTTMGIILGFVFRPLRLLAGGVVYVAIAFLFFALYVAWAATPAFLIVKAIVG